MKLYVTNDTEIGKKLLKFAVTATIYESKIAFLNKVYFIFIVGLFGIWYL